MIPEIYPETYEYPSRELLLEGPKDGQWFEYVSNTYLNGFINYTEILVGFIIKRYADENYDYYKVAEDLKTSYHTNFSKLEDDIIIISKGAGSYWYFWNDRDCSDCIIARTEINQSEEEFIESMRKKSLILSL